MRSASRSALVFHVIMACHNRKALTVQAIKSMQIAARLAGVTTTYTVFDDGSVDGTDSALNSINGPVHIIHGDGSAYWARGMASAESVLLATAGLKDDQFVVWLNDDVTVDDDAFSTVLRAQESHPGAVLVGAVRDPSTAQVTYSGMRRGGIHPLNFARVTPSDELQSVDTFNGNLVIVPVRTARALGGIDGGFSHALADVDYGLRCQRLGVPVLLLPGTLGTCPRNPKPAARSIRADWQSYIGVKGPGNYQSMKRILQRTSPNSWPVFMVISYLLWAIRRGSRHSQRAVASA